MNFDSCCEVSVFLGWFSLRWETFAWFYIYYKVVGWENLNFDSKKGGKSVFKGKVEGNTGESSFLPRNWVSKK